MVSASILLATEHITLGPSAQDLALLLAPANNELPPPLVDSSSSSSSSSLPSSTPTTTATLPLPLVLSDRYETLLDPPPVLVSGCVRLTGVVKNLTSVQIALVGFERQWHPANPRVRKELVNERVVLWTKEETSAAAAESPREDQDGGRTRRTRRLLNGCHKFPFSIPLPADVPPTLKVQYGQVAYKLIVTLHRAVLYPLRFTQSLSVRRCVPLFLRFPVTNHFPDSSRRSATLDETTKQLEVYCAQPQPLPQRPLTPPPSPAAAAPAADRTRRQFPLAPHTQHDSFTGPTASSEFTYTVTLPRAILRNTITTNNNNNTDIATTTSGSKNKPHTSHADTTHVIMLHLAPNTQRLDTIRGLECMIVERRSFRSSIIPTRQLPTIAPTVEEVVLTRPAVRYKLARTSGKKKVRRRVSGGVDSGFDEKEEEEEEEVVIDVDSDCDGGDEDENEEEEEKAGPLLPPSSTRSMPFMMSIGSDATVDVSTPTLAISHVVRIVVEYEPASRAASPSSTSDRPRSPTTTTTTTTTSPPPTTPTTTTTTISTSSMWRGRGPTSDAKRKTRVTIEIPVHIADALDDDQTDTEGDDYDGRASSRNPLPRHGGLLDHPPPSTDCNGHSSSMRLETSSSPAITSLRMLSSPPPSP
ncbi:hypothetical protein HDU86_007598 [Geranomyces michiganensis]|nr:hypothetical protein HDU86_007598 [Geranomyces michiganensis]